MNERQRAATRKNRNSSVDARRTLSSQRTDYHMKRIRRRFFEFSGQSLPPTTLQDDPQKTPTESELSGPEPPRDLRATQALGKGRQIACRIEPFAHIGSSSRLRCTLGWALALAGWCTLKAACLSLTLSVQGSPWQCGLTCLRQGSRSE